MLKLHPYSQEKKYEFTWYTPNRNQNPDLQSILEQIIEKEKELQNVISQLNNIPKLVYPALKKNERSSPGFDLESGARIRYVSPSELPSSKTGRVLGMYDQNTHTIYIANNLSYAVERFVYHHEVAPALGILDERQADYYAIRKLGYMLPGREHFHGGRSLDEIVRKAA